VRCRRNLRVSLFSLVLLVILVRLPSSALPPRSDADQDQRVKRDQMYMLKETCNFAANLPAQAPIHDKEQELPGIV